MNGVFLKEGEQIGIIDPTTGAEQLDQVEDERQFETTEVEQKVTAPDSNRQDSRRDQKIRLEHQEQYGRFPKTLIFAVNDLPHTSHADNLVEIARDVFGQGDSFVQKITGRVDRPLQRIREFRNRPEPHVVVSVDMLTTGVDIPDLEYIVFLRPVKSRILFEQMLGRGTRKGEKFPDKSHFTVFDCFDGTLLEYFRRLLPSLRSLLKENSERSSRSLMTFGTIAIGTTTFVASFDVFNASTRKCRAKRAKCSLLTSLMVTWRVTLPSLPGNLQQRLYWNDGIVTQCQTSRSAR